MSIATFGEIMLRLTSSAPGEKLADSRNFSVNYAGSESNVASALAALGNNVQFVSKLPENEIGDGAIRSLRYYGVDTSLILRGGKRLGTYFIELGSSIRPSKVVYDRQNSAFAEISPNEFDWLKILKGHSWVFLSGITAALSPQCATAAIAMVETAKMLGVKVAFDFNYRRTLWNDAAEASMIFNKILKSTDLLLGNAGSLVDVYQVDIKGDTEEEKAEYAAKLAADMFSLKQVAFTIREHVSASTNRLSAVYFNQGQTYKAPEYTVEISDRFGSGDAFAAALLHGLSSNWDNRQSIDFATAAFALKHTIPGDQHTSTVKEIISIMEGNTSGHVIR